MAKAKGKHHSSAAKAAMPSSTSPPTSPLPPPPSLTGSVHGMLASSAATPGSGGKQKTSPVNPSPDTRGSHTTAEFAAGLAVAKTSASPTSGSTASATALASRATDSWVVTQLRLLLILIATVPGGALIVFDMLMPHDQRREAPLSVGSVRVFDLLDPLFIVPFMSVALRKVDQLCFHSRAHRRGDSSLQWTAYLLFVAYVYGSAMHFVSNALNVLSTELNDFRPGLPPVLYDLIYFFDEHLGHWVMFLSLFALICVYVLACEAWSTTMEWSTIGAAVLMGLTWSIGIIESSHAWMGFAAAAMLLLAVAVRMYILGTHQRITPLLAFAVALAVALPLGELIYFVSVGSFAEPSELGGTKRVFQIAMQRWRHGLARIGSHAV